MDFIPVYSGGTGQFESCGHFLSLIDEYATKESLTEEQVKEFCMSKLSEQALDFVRANSNVPWQDLKFLMLKHFSAKLSIKDKVEVRRKLQQKEMEPIDDFYNRCLHAQFLVSDDIRDATFEREVLLHFLIGLSPYIRDLVLTAKCSNTQDFILEAKKHFVKNEPLEPNVKLEPGFDDDYVPDPVGDFDEDFMIQYNGNEKYYQSENFDVPEYDDDNEEENWYPSEEDKKISIKKVKKKLSKVGGKIKEKNLKCPLCDKKFRTVKGRQNHVEESHQDARKTCTICQEDCSDIQALARHMVQKHCETNDKNQYVCLYCNTFQRRRLRDVRNHIMAVHWEQPDIYCTCKECGRVFEKQPELKLHIKTAHQNERPFQCDKCPKTFKVIGGLNMHIITHHEEPNEVSRIDIRSMYSYSGF